MLTPRFGISTHLYQGQRLTRDCLLEIAASGFPAIELFATRTHIDYHNPAAIADLQQLMAEAGVELASVHAPIARAYEGTRWMDQISIASTDRSEREAAVEEVQRALYIARRIPFSVLVVHLGWPRPAENSRDAARRSIETLCETAAPLGVTIAVEVIQNELSRAAPLVHFVEEVVDPARVRICLDCGHAHIDDDLVDAIETVSEHLEHMHVHDNQRRSDDHLVPFEGTIDWPAAMTQVQKVGYDGVLMFELAARGPAKETLKRAARARDRLRGLLA